MVKRREERKKKKGKMKVCSKVRKSKLSPSFGYFGLDLRLVICKLVLVGSCGPALFNVCVLTRWARLAFCVCWKTILKKRFGVATYFRFILKGKNKIRKKNPKCDS